MKSKWVKASDLAKAKSWKFENVKMEPKPAITMDDFDWRVRIYEGAWYGAARANLMFGGAPLYGVAVFIKRGSDLQKYVTTEGAALNWLVERCCPLELAKELFSQLPVEKGGGR